MLSLVIPVYNEEKIIAETMKTVLAYMPNNFADYEVIIVDDGSTDGTLEIAEKLSDENITVISYEKNKGKGGAVKAGIMAAGGDFVFYTDCDLAYGLDVIKEGHEFFKKSKETDVLVGSRKKHKDGYAGYTFLRKIMSVAFLSILKIYGGIKQSESQSGMKGFKTEAAKKIFALCESDGWIFDFEALLIAQKLKLKIEEIPITVINHRESKIDPMKDSIKMLREIPKIKKRVKKLNLDKGER
jgi:dolichyl-phosphate beta-glucosyltransferase